MLSLIIFITFLVGFKPVLSVGTPEKGVYQFKLNETSRSVIISKTMFNNTGIALKVACSPTVKKLTLKWVLRWTPCMDESVRFTDERRKYLLTFPLTASGNECSVNQQCSYKRGSDSLKCESEDPVYVDLKSPSTENDVETAVCNCPSARGGVASSGSTTSTNVPTSSTPARSKREAGKESPTPTSTTTTATNAGSVPSSDSTDSDHSIVTTWRKGTFIFLVNAEFEGKNSFVTIVTEMKAPSGFLSASDFPLFVFYIFMCAIYSIYALLWLVYLGCYWQDLLRVQFWIGGVIALGLLTDCLLEKAVFLAEYESSNKTGDPTSAAILLAELISSLKRAVARMLVIIVSVGFGIVKPRLGPILHKVVGVGAIFFICASIEGCLRALTPLGDPRKLSLLAAIPLAVIDAGICWWIFTALAQTLRTLRLRRNPVKLSLYRHFTNTLIFAVLASIAFMVWSIKVFRWTDCITSYGEVWLDDAFWHLLFSVILLVIMFLLRPSMNSQRFAFSHLTDDDDGEEKEPMINDAFEGIKMRSTTNQKDEKNGPSKPPRNKAEEDLKWVDENIPPSVGAALPSLLDSDEEVMTTKFEMSKID